MKNKKGFTLVEILVAVLIIGILAAIALPQYQMAVTKAKVTSVLPFMRRWHDALTIYYLTHGAYCKDETCLNSRPSDYDASWPADWKEYDSGDPTNSPCGNAIQCGNDYWFCNAATGGGMVMCSHNIDDLNSFRIVIWPHDDLNKITCDGAGSGKKVCKALGWEVIEETEEEGIDYGTYEL